MIANFQLLIKEIYPTIYFNYMPLALALYYVLLCAYVP